MAVSGILGRENLTRLRIQVDLPEEIFAGVETLAVIRLENTGRCWPRFLLKVSLEGTAQLVPVIRPGSEAKRRIRVVFPSRGSRTLSEARIQSPFPVNFFVRSRVVPVARTLTVFPRPVPCLAGGREGREKNQGERPADRKGFEGEVSRIADYRGGDPLKLIHWRLSARQDQLVIRELSDPQMAPVIIDPDLLAGKDLEARLSCAVYWVLRLIREQRWVGLKLGPKRIPPGQGRAQKVRLLTALATYGEN